jgi:hypothetical protein
MQINNRRQKFGEGMQTFQCSIGDNKFALPAANYQIGLLEETEVMRNSWLRH